MSMKRLKQLLEKEHSKKQKDIITSEILKNHIPVSALIELIQNDNGIYAQRGAYVITGIHDTDKNLLAPYTMDLWKCIHPKNHPSIPRAVYRYLADIKIPKELDGEIFESGTKAFVNKRTTIAVKAHIMKILTNLAVKYPELKAEVIFLINQQLKGSSSGYKSAAKKELKRLL